MSFFRKRRRPRVKRRPRRLRPFGFTLLELMIAIAILAAITLLIYGAFAGMKQTRDGVLRVSDRYREGRLALERIGRDLQSAYLSQHLPIDQALTAVTTAFIGTQGTPADRVDFNSFAHRRLDRDSHESDQIEVSYFGSPDPQHQGVVDLARRVSPILDTEPSRGGRVEVLATDIDLFDLEYLDAMTGEWTDTWDTRQAATGQPNRIPLQVRVTLVLNGGKRSAAGRGRDTIRFSSKLVLPIQKPLTFALQ